MVEGLGWIFVGKVAERINMNSNQKLHAKSYVLRGGGQHILRALQQVDTQLSVVRHPLQNLFCNIRGIRKITHLIAFLDTPWLFE